MATPQMHNSSDVLVSQSFAINATTTVTTTTAATTTTTAHLRNQSDENNIHTLQTIYNKLSSHIIGIKYLNERRNYL